MVSIFKKKTVEEQRDSGEEPLVVLRGLEKEEVSLMEEKRELLASKEKLQIKAVEKIEIMNRRIQTLKNEISELRHQCEELENSVS
jgi:predicted RNase H-like nuclease (RuvC/YqgF family)